jgi:hypothetical protein
MKGTVEDTTGRKLGNESGDGEVGGGSKDYTVRKYLCTNASLEPLRNTHLFKIPSQVR